MRARARREDGFGRMEVAAYAERVVREIVRGREGKLWIGTAAGMARFGSWGVPQGLLVSFLFCFPWMEGGGEGEVTCV